MFILQFFVHRKIEKIKVKANVYQLHNSNYIITMPSTFLILKEAPSTFLILKAANFAAEKHRDQRRKNSYNSPYINHPIGVAYNISKIGSIDDTATIIAALLHDTVEDTETTFDEIEKEFDAEVAAIVRDVTDDKSLPAYQRKLKQIEHAPHLSPKAKVVKLSDKLYNLQDLCKNTPKGWSLERVQGYFVWSWFVVNGLRETSTGLEAELFSLFNGEFEFEGKRYPCLTQPVTQEQLDSYINMMKGE